MRQCTLKNRLIFPNRMPAECFRVTIKSPCDIDTRNRVSFARRRADRAAIAFAQRPDRAKTVIYEPEIPPWQGNFFLPPLFVGFSFRPEVAQERWERERPVNAAPIRESAGK
ncbi:MAG: hypothetical protein HQK81_05180 [Desulfovibrionaceae bacterium]|nr:hypothetical protein [Desulfovibrionaceae bacterium]